LGIDVDQGGQSHAGGQTRLALHHHQRAKVTKRQRNRLGGPLLNEFSGDAELMAGFMVKAMMLVVVHRLVLPGDRAAWNRNSVFFV
jgi:hypothetical protein